MNRAITPIRHPSTPSPTPHVFTMPELPADAFGIGENLRSLPARIGLERSYLRTLTVPAVLVTKPAELRVFDSLGYRSPRRAWGADLPVFNGPPKPADIQQSAIYGNCWALAVAGAVARTRPGDITDRLQVDGRVATMRWGTPEGSRGSVTVDTRVPVYRVDHGTLVGAARPTERVIWPAMLEKSVAAATPGGYEVHGLSGGNVVTEQDFMQALTGRRADIAASGHAELGLPHMRDFTPQAITEILTSAERERRPVVVTFAAPDGSPEHLRMTEKGIVNRHAYWLDTVAEGGSVHLGNPHGFNHGVLTIDEVRELSSGMVVGSNEVIGA